MNGVENQTTRESELLARGKAILLLEERLCRM